METGTLGDTGATVSRLGLGLAEIRGAMEDAKATGKTRFIGFSGDNDAARWCVDQGGFDVLESSLSVVDQHGRATGLLRTAKERGME